MREVNWTALNMALCEALKVERIYESRRHALALAAAGALGVEVPRNAE